MKNLITYLKALWSRVADSQSTDVSLDCRRSDLRRSPSGLDAKWKQNPFMRFAVVLTLIFTIGIGNVWGADSQLYFEGWESHHRTSGSNNYGATAKTYGDFSFVYADAITTGSPLTGTANAVLRNAKNTNQTCSLTSTALLSSSYEIHTIKWNCKRGVSNQNLKVYYSTNGSTWTKGYDAALPSSKTESSITSLSITGPIYLKFEVTYNNTSKSNYDAQIDDIALWGEEVTACSTTPTVGSALSSISTTTTSITATVPISAIGECDITENGLVYSTSVATPTVGAANCTKVTTTACGSTATDKEVEITGLTCGTSYYVRGYATNNAGTSYTNVKTQSTSACPTYTITYNAGTGTCGTAQWTQPSYGASTTLPSATAPATCSGYTFAGWCTSSAGSADENTSSPGEILTGSYTPANDITLYAVYTKTIGGGGSSWAETDFADLTSSDVFVLATPAGYALPSNGGDAKPVVSAITVSAGKITSTVTDGLKWNMSGNSTDGYIFYPNGTTSTWLCCTTTASSGSNDNIRINNTGTRKVWILDSDGDLRTNDTYTNRWLCCYNSADFRGYIGSNVTSDIISKCYKYTTSGTTYYMTSLVCCTELGTINGSVSWSGGNATVSWDAAGGCGSWGLKYKTHAAEDIPANWTSYAGSFGTADSRTSNSTAISGLDAGVNYDFKITGTSDGSVYCSGTVTETKSSTVPKITASSSMTDLGYQEGETPVAQTFTITGTQLTGNLTVTAPSNFLVSLDGSSWSAAGGSKTVTVSTPPNNLGSTTIHVKANSGLSEGAAPSGNITISGGGAASVNVAVSATITEACTAPSSVTITGTTKYFGGQTISLTATPSGGAGEASYQWQKKVSGVWTNVANGGGISGATTNNLQISSCTHSNSGGYRCVVSTGTTCSTKSHADDNAGYGVHVYSIYGRYYNEGEWAHNEIAYTSGTTGTATVHLSAKKTYTFKVRSNNDLYYGNSSGNFIIQPATNMDCGTNNSEIRLFTTIEGDYTITVDIAHGLDNSPYVTIAVSYPSVTHPSTGYVYVQKFNWRPYLHYWYDNSNKLTEWGSDPQLNSDQYTTICGTEYWCVPVIDYYCNFIAKDAAGDPSNTTGDQHTNSPHPGQKLYNDGSWKWAAFPTYSISYEGGTGSSGSMSDETGIAGGSSQTLTAFNTIAKAGYTFSCWHADQDVTIGGSTVSEGDDISDGATIQNVCGNITLTAQWTANTNTAYTVKHYQQNIADNNYTEVTGDRQNLTGTTDASVTPAVKSYTGFTAPSTQTVTILGDGSLVVDYYYTRNSYNLTWNLGGGTTTTAGTGIANGVSVNTTSSVKYGTSLTAPTVTKTGYGFSAWSPSAPASTMPAAATTYTATWSATNYSITYNGLEGATNSNPANYTIESSAITLVDPGTRDGYTFAGWYTNEGKTSPVSTPAIAAGSTGNKTFWAKWDRNYYTITWHVGASTSTTEDVEHGTTFSTLEASAPAHADNALAACGSTKFIGWVKASGAFTEDGKTVTWYNTHKFSSSDQITADTHVYAMYAEAAGAAIYSRVTSDLGATNWAGDYLIAYSSTVFADGRTAGTSGMGANGAKVDPGDKLGTLVDTVNLAWGNTYNVTLELIDNSTNTYVLKTKDGNYNYQTSNANGITSTANKATAAAYPISVTFTSSSDIKLALGGDATGAVFRYNTSSSGYFRFYKDCGQSAVYLYKKTQNLTNYRTGCSVSCSRPTPATPASITKTGATISWAAGSTGTPESYEYKVWEDGTDEPVSGTTTTGTSVNLTGLYSGVTYHWKVKADCGDVDGESIWATGTNFTTTAANLTYSVPTGATAVTTPTTTAGNLNSAEVPASCGSCWAFVGWTTDAISTPTSSAPAALFPAGTKAKVSGDATLHAVYTKSTYRIVGGLSEIDADEYYVISFSQDGVTSAMANAVTNTYYVTEEEMPIKEDNTGAYIESPDEDAIWKFTGTTSAGRFQNVGNDKYLDLSNSSNPPIASSTSDYVNITVFNSSNKMFDIESNATDENYLQLYSKGWGVDDDHSGYYSCRLFKRAGSSYTTVPDCRTFTVTWDVNNGATTSTSNVTKCQGYLASLPDNPLNTTLSSCQTNGKFMGWSPTKVMPAQNAVPTDMFSEKEYSPEITQDTTFYAVFAEEHSGATGATDRTYTFTSASWEDDESAWSSGAAGNWNSSAVQVTKNKTGANATTISSYNAVTKVAVTYFTNASSGAGSIDIKVNGTSYTGSASVTKSGGTTPRTINFTPPSSALDGAVKITVTCTDNSIYIKSVQIFYTGSTTTYDQYRTACCNDPQLKFLDGEGDPTTEYVIVREDLASSSAGVTIGCDISSLNTTGTISWTSTHRDKNDYASAYTWSSTQPVNLNIDIAKEEITAKETGVWQITISQAAGATTYCPEDATVTVRVKTIDKFVDAVNGNFSGEPQSLEDTGNGILLPTEAMFSTNNGCSTTRRLIGWIKASDLATYASSRRVNMIDDLKTSDPATNKVIAPGTKVQATGVTWYAVWGVEK